MEDFRRLLNELAVSYGGSKQAFAQAIGITPSHLSHLLTETPNQRSAPSTDVCLAIAAAAHANPSTVLRSAGKGEIADQLETLYGPAAERRQAFLATTRLSPADEKYLGVWRHLSAKDKRALIHILDRFSTQLAAVAPFQATGGGTRRVK